MHDRLAWIVPATHVCSRWRVVAIAHSCLWTDISPSLGLQWALEMMRRACQAPVNVHMEEGCTPLSDYVAEHIDHMRDFQLEGGDPAEMTSIIARLNHRAPLLERVTIACNTTYENGNTVYFPPDLFAYAAPRLRHVQFTNCTIPWNHTLFAASLVSLDISLLVESPTASAAPGDQFTCTEVLDILERTPALKVLNLGFILVPVHTSMGTSRRVSLPHLDAMRLEGPLNGCRWLAASLDLPAHTSIRMVCLSFSDNGEDCHLLVPFIIKRIAAAATLHPTEHLYLGSEMDVYMRFAVGSLETCRARSSTPPLDISVIVPLPGGEILRRLFEAFCAVFPLDKVQELVVNTGPSERWFQPQYWQEPLRKAKRVATLKVMGVSAGQLVSPLKVESNAGEPPDEASTLLFPELKTLEIRDTNIHDDTSGTPRLDEGLLGALASRTTKAPLETLKFLRCKVQKECIEKFEAIVPIVTVDSGARFPLRRQ